MLFTLTDDPQFHILEVSFSNVLMIGLFHSNIRMVSFSKTEKKSYHRKHVRDHTFMTSTWKEDVQWGVLNICHVIADFFVFKQKIYCSFFADVESSGSHNWSFFVDVMNLWPLNGLKLQPISLLEAGISTSTSNQIHFDCRREQPPAPPSPNPLMTKPKDLLLSVGTYFLCEKKLWFNQGCSHWGSKGDHGLPTSISEPKKVQQFQFQTSGMLLFTGVQKLYGPEISWFLSCMLQFLANLRWLFIICNYIGETDHFTLDHQETRKKTTMNESLFRC